MLTGLSKHFHKFLGGFQLVYLNDLTYSLLCITVYLCKYFTTFTTTYVCLIVKNTKQLIVDEKEAVITPLKCPIQKSDLIPVET